MRLSEQERRRIDERIAAFESHTGAQVVTAVVDKCDHYPEIPWKAFALGASLAAFARVALDFVHPDWLTSRAALLDAVVILGCGALLALASIMLRSLGRLFLHGARAVADAGVAPRNLRDGGGRALPDRTRGRQRGDFERADATETRDHAQGTRRAYRQPGRRAHRAHARWRKRGGIRDPRFRHLEAGQKRQGQRRAVDRCGQG